MIYVEFIDRDRFMAIEIFRIFGQQTAWTAPEDTMIANLGRTMRVGPHPSYMCFWRIKGMARMDEWEIYFRTEEGLRDLSAAAALRAIHFERSGLYDEIVSGPPLGDGLHYVEFFGADEDAADEDIHDHFATRAKQHSNGKIGFVLRRIGLLGPEPGGLAVWTFPNYVDMESIARERHGASPFRPTMAGVYRNFGDEIL